MKEKIVNQIKERVAQGRLQEAIELLSRHIYDNNEFPEDYFRDIIHDFYFIEKKEVLGEFTYREKTEEENALVIKLFRKLNKFITKPIDFVGINENELLKMSQWISKGEPQIVIENLLLKDNLPIIIKDRIIKISFEYSQIQSLLFQGTVGQNEEMNLMNKVSSNLIKILKSLKNIDQFKFYNDNTLVFVVIAFDQEMDTIYETIKEVGKSFNLEPIRVKDVPGDYRITNKIIDLIKKSKFIVADLSLEKPNVYFELGYARGLGKEIITICNQETKIHFDVKDWTCLYYSDSQNLKINLQTRFEVQIVNGE